MIFEKAKALMSSSQQESDEDLEVPADADSVFDDIPFPEKPEEDIEGLTAMKDGPLVRQTDEESVKEIDDDRTIAYITAVKIFIKIILTNSLSEHTDAKNNLVKCSLCLEDDSVDQYMKVRSMDPSKHNWD